MLKTIALLSAICAVVLAPAMAQTKDGLDPTGLWSVEGRNPDGGAYRGVAKVVRRGDGYAVEWRIGAQTFTGWALHSRDSFAVAVLSEERADPQGDATEPPVLRAAGVALYVLDGEGRLIGTWSYPQNGRLGLEVWTRDKSDDAPRRG